MSVLRWPAAALWFLVAALTVVAQQRPDPAELVRRAESLEKEGRLKDALTAYLDLGLASDGTRLIATADDLLKATPATISAGRIAAIMGRAGDADPKGCEEELSRRWRDAKDSKDPEKVWRFLRLVGTRSAFGRKAHLAAAETLIDRRAYREAELLLLAVRRQTDDLVAAALAAEQLGQLSLVEEQPGAAAAWYRGLDRDFTAVKLRDGKTGADLFKELSAEKRVAAWLQAHGLDQRRRVRGTQKGGDFSAEPTPVPLRDADGQLPDHLRVRFEFRDRALTVHDRDDKEPWSATIPRTTPRSMSVPLSAHALGRMVILRSGGRLYGVEPRGRGLVWDHELTAGDSATKSSSEVSSAASAVVLMTAEGLTAVEPSGGGVLWRRSDLTGDVHLSGGESFVLAKSFDAEGLLKTVRAFRRADGAELTLDKETDWKKEVVRTSGDGVLLFRPDRDGKSVLRLHDPLRGKDVWSSTFAAGAVPLLTIEPRLGGVVELDGTVTVLDTGTGAKVTTMTVDPKPLEKVRSAALIRDPEKWYVIFNGPPDPMAKAESVPWAGTQTVRVNGRVYAYQRDSLQLVWRSEIPDQWVVLDHFQEVSFFLCVSRGVKRLQGGSEGQVTAVRALSKQHGKIQADDPNIGLGQQVRFGIRWEAAEGKFSLMSPNFMYSLTVER